MRQPHRLIFALGATLALLAPWALAQTAGAQPTASRALPRQWRSPAEPAGPLRRMASTLGAPARAEDRR